jgi:hypothetical protein
MAATKKVERRDLRNGARIAVQLVAGEICTTFSRPDTPLGDIELATFVNHCGVPVGARRWPPEGQRTVDDDGRTRHIVGYTWPDMPPMTLE